MRFAIERVVLYCLLFVIAPTREIEHGVAIAGEPAAVILAPPVSRKIDFRADVQPILTRHCIGCHDAAKHKGGLRLDRKAEAFAGGGSGVVLEPGKGGESLLIEYVEGTDPTMVMPPKGERLSADQIGILRAWIDQGADWPDDAQLVSSPSNGTDDPAVEHWSFRPVVRPDPPAVTAADRVRNAIDAFIQAALASRGMSPSPEADRSTLARRLSFDLLGLPPTPSEISAFVDDTSADAYERLVDRMLASPRFGERWGRHWLDLARYADSDGYEKDLPRPNAWRFRDWVLEALNRDLSFDQFTTAQLAGDLVPNADVWTMIGTGFHRNTLTNREGGVDQEEYRVQAVVDRVNTTGTVWLGLTVGCAQCHTHKYDPILHKEYYGLFAFFNSEKEEDVTVPLPQEQASFEKVKAAHDAEQSRLEKSLATYDGDVGPVRQHVWEELSASSVRHSHWHPVAPRTATAESKVKLSVQPDRSILAAGKTAASDTYTLSFDTNLSFISAIRLEVLPDPSLPSAGPGRASDGDFVLSELSASAAPKSDPTRMRQIPLRNARADVSPPKFGVDHAIDGDPKTGWAVSGGTSRRHVAVFDVGEDFDAREGWILTLALDQKHGEGRALGRFRVSLSDATETAPLNGLTDDVAEVLAVAPADRSPRQAALVADYHRSIDPDRALLLQAVLRHASKAPPPPSSKVPVLVDNPRPPSTHILIRGDFLRKGDRVQPGTPAVLPPLRHSGDSPSRLDLARWLVDPANPLTARVAVNRVWQHLFGRGIVRTLDDFGVRGEPPSHPELLDWLASEFVARGWSQKALIRTIVCSSTYRQSSTARPELVERDPTNVWLARQNRLRLEAETLRDATLSVSGLLTPVVGGPSVRPPQPAGISDLTYAGSAKWVQSRGPDRYRRGLYTWFQRTSPYPMLMTFDAPDSNVCVVKRERSNTPLQALTLLNDVTFFDCARALGDRAMGESAGDVDARIRYMFRMCLARDPSEEESSILRRFHDALVDECRANPAETAKLVGAPRSDRNDIDAAGSVALARALLNLDEFVTRE